MTLKTPKVMMIEVKSPDITVASAKAPAAAVLPKPNDSQDPNDQTDDEALEALRDRLLTLHAALHNLKQTLDVLDAAETQKLLPQSNTPVLN